MYRFFLFSTALWALAPLSSQAGQTVLGEQPADTANLLGWKVLGGFEQGSSELVVDLKVIPASSSGACLIQLNRLSSEPLEQAVGEKEMIAATTVFIPAREPIWAHRLSVSIPITLSIPEDIPDGYYQLEAVALSGQRLDGTATYDLKRGDPSPVRPEESLVVISGATPRDWTVILPGTLVRDITGSALTAPVLEAWLYSADDILQATASYPIGEAAASASSEITVRLPDDERWNSVADGRLQFHVGGSTARASVPFVSGAQAVTRLKPMASGVYRESDGTSHYWYADDEHALYWDGRPWVPFGGMFYVFKMKLTPRERDAEREKLTSQLDILQQAGFQDLYVNMGVGQTSPEWYLQTVVDEFNRRGIRFGWQLTVGAKPFTAWEIYSSSSQGLITATVETQGVLTLTLPEVPITELLIVPANGSGSAHRVPYSSEVSHVKAGLEIAQILESEDNANRQEATLRVPGLAPGKYYVLANVIQQGKRVSNVWDRLDEIKSGLTWISRIDWGEGLRFFVDPVCNESGFNQRYETVRVSSSSFDAEFSEWLRDRYGNDLQALAEAWAIAPDTLGDFDQAARLLPLRDLDARDFTGANSLTLVDPLTGALFQTHDGPGASWLDYLQAVRISYAHKLDEVARYIKSLVDVPVVIKRVSPWVSLESVVQTPGGIDGIGIEPYPEDGSSIPYCNLSGRAEADLSAQTTWLLATEIGYSSKPGNKGVRSWPDQETMERVVREALYVGAKGVFLFGWRLPGHEWANHALLNQPDRLQWAREVANSIQADPSEAWAQYGVIFPEGQSWWWRSNGKLWTRYNCVYENAPSAFSQSVRLSGEDEDALWAVSSSIPLPGADPVIINLTDAYFADYYADDIDRYIDAGKHIVYLGHWPEGADKPSRLARHFVEGQQVKHPDGRGKIQPLRIFEGDEVLAKDADGNVWAKINPQERVLIVSVTPAAPAAKNSSQLPAYLNAEWISRLLSGPSTQP